MTIEQAIAEGRAAFVAADYTRAINIFQQVLRARPNTPEVLYDLARCDMQMGRFADARRSLEIVKRSLPNVPDVHVQLARTFELERKFPEALAAIDEALRLAPGNLSAIARKATILDESGEKQAAYDLLIPHFNTAKPDPDIAFTLGRVARRVGKPDEARAAYEAVLPNPALSQIARSQVLYRLGALLDEQKDFDRAFALYTEANAARKANYNAADTTALVDRIISVWTKDAIASLPRASVTHKGMVFIVGMPRAGKTLVEQILASHPRVYGSGELSYMNQVVRQLNAVSGAHTDASKRLPGEMQSVTDIGVVTRANLDRVTREYIQHTTKGAASAAIVTDKFALNYFHLGLIQLMFPDARILHCSRHPFDTCLSCYFQSWTGSYHFSHDLRDLALFYKDYQRLMDHWKKTLDLPILDLKYEDLVENQEPRTRDMIDFLGLPWDDRCLRFYETNRSAQLVNQEQVRKPMYRSALARYKNYAKHIAPLQDAFGFRE